MTHLRWLSLTVLALGCHTRQPGPFDPGHDGYRIHQDVVLHASGVHDAHLQLLEDDRITPTIRASFQRGLPDDLCASPSSASVHAFCVAIARRPLRPALVRLASTTGAELDTIALERPVADAMPVILATESEPTLYGVSVDLTADVGTYSGPLVRLLDARDRQLRWERARDALSDSTEELVLPTTPKTAWRVVPRADGSGHDILLIACRPTFAEPSATEGFAVTYARVSFVAGEWHRYRRVAPGCWENEGAFPPRAQFP